MKRDVLDEALSEISAAHACERLSIYWNMVFAILTLFSSIFIAIAIYSMDVMFIVILLLLSRVLILSLTNTEEFANKLDALAYSVQTLLSKRTKKRYSLILLSALLTFSMAYTSYTLGSKPLALLAFELANLSLYLALTPKPYSVEGTATAFLVSLPLLLAITFSGEIPSLTPFVLITISDLGYILSINLKGVKECLTVIKSIAS